MSGQPLVRGLQPPWPGQQTDLHQAARVGNSDGMSALIKGGCAVDLQDREGNTALHEVSWHGFSHCVKLLLKAQANVHIQNKAGNTALHLACQNAHAQTAHLLLLEGSMPDTKNNVGDTCLHVAACYNNVSLVKMLLGCLCSLTLRNQKGDTALHVAAALNHKRTAQLLLDAGIDGSVRNYEGKTALDKARDNNHKDMALLLARARQAHCLLWRRTIKKQRERSKLITKVQILPNKAVNEDEQRKGKKNLHIEKDLLQEGIDNFSVQNEKMYQLYTLYRDKDGKIRQAKVNGCSCKPLYKKLEDQLKVTKEEMRLHILSIQKQVNSRLGKMEHRTQHQIKVLDMLNQERAEAERKHMLRRMEQKAARGREETLMTQAAVSHKLKKWCMSQLREVEVHVPAQRHYYKLLPSPSLEQYEADAELESLPLLSVLSTDSSTSLATYVNILPSKSSHSQGTLQSENLGNGKYFEMKVDRSPDDYENTAMFPWPVNCPFGLLMDSADSLWHSATVQDNPNTSLLPVCGEVFSSSSSASTQSISEPSQMVLQQEKLYDLQGTCRHAGIHTESTHKLELFIDHPMEPTVAQERNNLHAKEVTQRFFETVSTQLERWYERKVVEVEQQMELRVQQDKKKLLQHISRLEEELDRLRNSENAES